MTWITMLLLAAAYVSAIILFYLPPPKGDRGGWNFQAFLLLVGTVYSLLPGENFAVAGGISLFLSAFLGLTRLVAWLFLRMLARVLPMLL